MKAYVIERAGGPDVLQIRDIPSVAPNADEVRIRVRAFGLNRAETYLRAGKMGPIDGPRVPGIEAVGEIVEDASGTFRVGQRVATAMGGLQFTRHGSYAEEVTVLRSNVIDLDGTTLSWEELAALPQAYLTIWGALHRSLGIEAGQTLLVRGATSTVGLAAVTYAKAAGLHVVATTRSAKNEERLFRAGADKVVVDSGTIADDVQRLYPEGIDAALEIVGASTLRDTAKTLRPFGAVTVIGLLGGPPVLEQFNLMADLPPAVRLSFFPSQLFGTPALPLDNAPLRMIADDIAGKRLPSSLERTFAFDEVRQAHELIESNRALGKLVVRV
ncbi:zinc-binding alcohol dehydrogenase family protein [Burkholderia cenocepacia]|uniref:zinc-binding alcohol dehydrogenase family protein n=1 Tax=Burkholderia cenocepacia TaxID=95486 RepID=UPI000481ADF1|nr:zinc-binding alcohol dehydrogenase family protein [Burkholderia cenocepacia]KOR21457.1 alcohol dehydrogenase [Burkholderia cenocepacia]MBR7979848.1 zinc-binding dehydrogenase [Burkholderia cenocepacia]MBR7995020.1 zinc-binding dehydrogenase [Burkholderia cenocepacia]